MVIIGPESKLVPCVVLSDEFAHLPESPLSDLSFCVSQLAKSVASVCEPLTLVNISARPGKNAKAAHIACLPLTIITLGSKLNVVRKDIVFILSDLSCKQALAVVLSVLPLSSVATQSLIED